MVTLADKSGGRISLLVRVCAEIWDGYFGINNKMEMELRLRLKFELESNAKLPSIWLVCLLADHWTWPMIEV